MPVLRPATRYLPILKKTADSKPASLPLAAEYTEAFLNAWQRLTHSGRHDMMRFKEAMLLLANDASLGPGWLDHALKAGWADYRECYSGGNFQLVYQLESHLQTLEKKAAKIFTADTLASRRYAGHGSRIREGLERRRSRAGRWTIARRKHD